MKKILFSVAVVSAFAFASCGGPSVCDCVKNSMEEEPDKDMAETCKKMMSGDGYSEEEQEEMRDEYDKCIEDIQAEESN